MLPLSKILRVDNQAVGVGKLLVWGSYDIETWKKELDSVVHIQMRPGRTLLAEIVPVEVAYGRTP